MTDDESAPAPIQQQLDLPVPAWERLRNAREAAGKTTQDLAEETRIPRRIIDAIETGNFGALPSGPYAVGFGRAIARAVGLPEAEIAEEIRNFSGRGSVRNESEIYEPVEASRLPPRMLAWTAAIIAIAMIVAFSIWRGYGSDATELATNTAAPAPGGEAATGTAAPANPGGAAPTSVPADNAPLIVRASGEVWFGLNDANGRLVFERTLAAGESYALTPEQRGMSLRTGRPQHLRLVFGDRELPQLGEADTLVRDVALDTAGLATRLSGGAAPAPRPAPAGQPASSN